MPLLTETPPRPAPPRPASMEDGALRPLALFEAHAEAFRVLASLEAKAEAELILLRNIADQIEAARLLRDIRAARARVEAVLVAALAGS